MSLNEFEKIDTKIRELLIWNRIHHPKADVDSCYLAKGKGGRVMIQLKSTYKTKLIGKMKYLEITEDWILKQVKHHEDQKKSYIQCRRKLRNLRKDGIWRMNPKKCSAGSR